MTIDTVLVRKWILRFLKSVEQNEGSYVNGCRHTLTALLDLLNIYESMNQDQNAMQYDENRIEHVVQG